MSASISIWRDSLGGLHFLARRGDISGRFDDPLTAIVMLVQLFPETFEHGDERAGRLLRLACVRHGVVSLSFVLVHLPRIRLCRRD